MELKNGQKWTKIPSIAVLNRTVEALRKRGFSVILAGNKVQALQKLKEMIPPGAEVMTGSSTTLQQIGFTEYYLSGKNPWKCLAVDIRNENDAERRLALRRKSVAADYFLASVGAVAETGELVAVDQSGSRVGAYPYAAKRVILVIGHQKITPTLEEAMQRVRKYVYYLEDERAKKEYGTGTSFGKWVIVEREIVKDRITVLLIKEPLGF